MMQLKIGMIILYKNKNQPKWRRQNRHGKRGRMKIIITTNETDNIIGLKEAIAMRMEDLVGIVRIDVEEKEKENEHH